MTEIERYMDRMSSGQDDLLVELERDTNLRAVKPQMLSGHLQGKLLEMLVRMMRPRRVLEIGTYTGYSALSMAAGLPEDGVIDTIEVEEELRYFTQPFLDRSPFGSKIVLHTGSVLDIVPQLPYSYDFVFIDGDKREYPDYLSMLLGDGIWSEPGAKVHSGSFIVADNILWYGKVAEPIKCNDLHTRQIDLFNSMVLNDSRLENVIVPVRDGINLIRVVAL